MSTFDDEDEERLEHPAAREAARWWVRGHYGGLNAAERDAFVRWCKTSPTHIAELLHTVRLYLVLESLRPLHQANEDQVLQVVPIRPSVARPAPTRRRLRPWLVAIAASAVSILGVWLSVSAFTHRVATEANEWRSFQLADGTRVTVGPRTQLRHTIDERERRIELARGEMLVHVAPDPLRPFVVDAGEVLIRATGTQFAVDRRQEGLRVTLAEGSIEVAAFDSGPDSSPVMLRAGEELHIIEHAPATRRRVDTVRTLAWAERMIILDGESIEHAVAEFNRRNRVQIEIPSAIASLAMHGTYSMDDPESFAMTLATATQRTLVREPMRLRVGEEVSEE